MKTLEHQLVCLLQKANKKVSFAESLTGGMISQRLVSVPGASDVFGYGFVTYADDAKIEILGVSEMCINKYGAVSSQCAEEMVKGAYRISGADIAVSVTGFAGPATGDENEPVGCVYIGICDSGNISVERIVFSGNRQEIREKTTKRVLEKLISEL